MTLLAERQRRDAFEVSDRDDAIRRLVPLADGPAKMLAGTIQADPSFHALHGDRRFRILTERSGMDVARDPFAAPAAKTGSAP